MSSGNLSYCNLSIPCGIYQYGDEFYLGLPSTFHYESDSNNTFGSFAFRNVKSLIAGETNLPIYLIDNEEDSRIHDFKMIYQFPFNGSTTSYSSFKNTVDETRKQIKKVMAIKYRWFLQD